LCHAHLLLLLLLLLLLETTKLASTMCPVGVLMLCTLVSAAAAVHAEVS
jgi:hypothetical protein